MMINGDAVVWIAIEIANSSPICLWQACLLTCWLASWPAFHISTVHHKYWKRHRDIWHVWVRACMCVGWLHYPDLPYACFCFGYFRSNRLFVLFVAGGFWWLFLPTFVCFLIFLILRSLILAMWIIDLVKTYHYSGTDSDAAAAIRVRYDVAEANAQKCNSNQPLYGQRQMKTHGKSVINNFLKWSIIGLSKNEANHGHSHGY